MEQHFGAVAVDRRRRHAQAGRDVDLDSVEEDGLGQGVEHGAPDVEHLVAVAHGAHHHREGIALEARHRRHERAGRLPTHRAATQAAREALRHLPQHLVALLTAPGFVDLLEPVQVEEQHHDLGVRPRRGGQGLFQRALVRLAPRQPGQRIEGALRPVAILGLLLLEARKVRPHRRELLGRARRPHEPGGLLSDEAPREGLARHVRGSLVEGDASILRAGAEGEYGQGEGARAPAGRRAGQGRRGAEASRRRRRSPRPPRPPWLRRPRGSLPFRPRTRNARANAYPSGGSRSRGSPGAPSALSFPNPRGEGRFAPAWPEVLPWPSCPPLTFEAALGLPTGVDVLGLVRRP